MRFVLEVGDVEVDKNERAFCPGASPPDNSCSPANKGDGSNDGGGQPSAGPKRPPRDLSAIKTDADKRAYMEDTRAYLQETHGVGVKVYMYDGEPPSPFSVDTIAAGMDAYVAAGGTFEKNKRFNPAPVVLESRERSLVLGANSLAAYRGGADEVVVANDLSLLRLNQLHESGYLAGPREWAQEALVVHEFSHRDHFRSIKPIMSDQGVVALTPENRISELTGLPGVVRSKGRWRLEDSAWRKELRSPSDGAEDLTADIARKIAGKVSKYAETNPLEFVAEVRTGIAGGAKYTEDVMLLYNAYDGPELLAPVFRRKG